MDKTEPSSWAMDKAYELHEHSDDCSEAGPLYGGECVCGAQQAVTLAARAIDAAFVAGAEAMRAAALGEVQKGREMGETDLRQILRWVEMLPADLDTDTTKDTP